MIRKFDISISVHGTPAIQLENPTEAERMFLRRAVLTQFTDDIFYQKKQDASSFLQSESENFILVEFWGNAKDFADWLNSDDPEVLKAKKLAEDFADQQSDS